MVSGTFYIYTGNENPYSSEAYYLTLNSNGEPDLSPYSPSIIGSDSFLWKLQKVTSDSNFLSDIVSVSNTNYYLGICDGGTGICTLASEQAGNYIPPQQWTFYNSSVNETGIYTVDGIGYKYYWNTTQRTLNYNTNTTTMQTFYLLPSLSCYTETEKTGTLSVTNNCQTSNNYGKTLLLAVQTYRIVEDGSQGNINQDAVDIDVRGPEFCESSGNSNTCASNQFYNWTLKGGALSTDVNQSFETNSRILNGTSYEGLYYIYTTNSTSNSNSLTLGVTKTSSDAILFCSSISSGYGIQKISTYVSNETYSLAYDSCSNNNSIILVSDDMCGNNSIICDWNFIQNNS